MPSGDGYDAQRWRLLLFPAALELNLAALEDERLDALVPHAKQVNRSNAIVLLGNGARLVPLDLGHDAHRTFHPLGESAERPAQTMERHMREARRPEDAEMIAPRLLQATTLRRGAGEHPFV